MRVHQRFHRLEFGDADNQVLIREGEQPASIYLAWRVLDTVDTLAWHLPASRALLRRLDTLAVGFHRQHCDDDCVTGWRPSTGEPVPMCAFIPPSNQVDLWLDTLSRWHFTETREYRIYPEV